MPAYLFDLDGTLLDTETVWCDATAAYLVGKGFPVTSDETIPFVYGRAWTDVYRSIITRFPALNDISIYAMQAEMAEYFHAARETSDIRIPGSVELLKRLSQTAPCCIVSGAPREHIAEAVQIMNCAANLAFYIGAEDYARGKPAPDCFLLAARKLGIPPSNCVVFEDSAVGVAAGKSAGMRVVALSRPCRPKQDIAAADIILENLSDFAQ